MDIFQKLGNSYYTPAFFRMKVATHESLLDLNKVDELEFMQLYHEYIHFLQDVTTTYGLMNISNVSYYIRDAVYTIEHGSNKLFDHPHKIIDKGDYGYSNYRLWNVYRGSSIEPMLKNVSIDNLDIQKIPVNKTEVEMVFLDITDLDTSVKNSSVVFGGQILCEGMAYLMEKYVYTPVFKKRGEIYPDGDEYPYLICKKIVESIYPEISDKPVIMVGICDMSLMNYNSGLMFIRMVEHFRDIKLHEQFGNFQNIRDFVSYMYQEGLQFISGHQYDFDTMQKYVARELNKYFKCQEFEGNNRWIDMVFTRAAELRRKTPQFMLDIMIYCQGEDIRHNACFGEIFKYLGSPLMFNEDGEASINPPSGFDTKNYMPELFWAIQQLAYVFEEGKKRLPCKLKNHCDKSKNHGAPVTDGRCDSAPWARRLDKNLCPFAIMWQHWALSGYAPK